jgi:hypothetical protein
MSDGEWHQLSIPAAVALLSPAPFPWFIAGGLAIDHAVGRVVRDHVDLDVMILRRDARSARAVLGGWDCAIADPPGHLRPWQRETPLPAHVHDVWCRETTAGPWQIQLMIDECDDDMWRSRRNNSITKPLDAIGSRGQHGAMFLSVDIHLFYKAKAPRPKDIVDFEAALPVLSSSQRAWLRTSIITAYGSSHPWLLALAD